MLRLLAVALVSLSLFPALAGAESAEEKGRAIAGEARRLNTGWGDSQQRFLMILKNRHGEESRREMRGKSLEVTGDGDKSLIIFDTPKDVKGTAFLNITHRTGDDDQWIYLPALKRVKRISTRSKSGSFMGSEFAYEDIASHEVEKYRYRWIGDEIYREKDCFIVEFYPVDKAHSGYTKQIHWIDKAHYRVWKVEFYDRKLSLLKTLTLDGYEKYLDSYWRAGEMNMVNHQNGRSTRLLTKHIRFATGLTDRDFNSTRLPRVR